VIAVPAWMLDPSACAGMILGTPRVTLAALIDLHCLLTKRGFRRDSSTDSSIGEEKQGDQSAKTDRRDPLSFPTASRQLSIAFETIPIRGIPQTERAKIITHLAIILLQAASAATGDGNDDER